MARGEQFFSRGFCEGVEGWGRCVGIVCGECETEMIEARVGSHVAVNLFGRHARESVCVAQEQQITGGECCEARDGQNAEDNGDAVM